MNSKFRRIYFPKIKLVFVILVIFIFVIISIKLVATYSKFIHNTGLNPIAIAKILFGQGIKLKSSSDRVNLLMLGTSGGDYSGADLTDTMVVFSYDLKSSELTLLSIPRDIWSDTLKDKINSAYHYGQLKNSQGGLILSKVVVEDIIGIPIHYCLVIDFSIFKQLIDSIGGIEINVPNTFVDTEYPIAGKENDNCAGDPLYKCRYEEVKFEKGIQHMDGDRALKYVRSRHSEGEEGSDFARSKRQQEVILALKDKLTQPKQLFLIKRNYSLVNFIIKSIKSDMNWGEILSFGKKIILTNSNSIKRLSIDDLLKEPPEYEYQGRYVLVPVDNLDMLHNQIKNRFNISN